jgi:predicted lipoprotein with Yx(FWY)xxD motif
LTAKELGIYDPNRVDCKIVVDANGHSLYEFDLDTPTTSACTGACTNLWPALLVSGTPHAGTGIDAAKLAVLAVTAGSQVTYAGHPSTHSRTITRPAT